MCARCAHPLTPTVVARADVLAIADEVTATNDEDGVALVLERLSSA